MRFDQLYYFITAADVQSITLASNKIFITQQALSISIKNLEDELGVKLFNRTHTGISLSEDGKYLYSKALPILAMYEDIHKHFYHQIAEQWQGVLKVAVNPRVKEKFLPKIVSCFYREYPLVDIEYIPAENAEIMQLVENKAVDFGLLALLEIEKKLQITVPPHCQFTSFAKYKYDLLVHKESPLANHKTVSMATIVKYPVILKRMDNFDSDLFFQLIQYYSSDAKIIWADSAALYNQLLVDNVGHTFYPNELNDYQENIKAIPIVNNIKTYTGYVVNTSKEESALQELFLNKLLELIQE